MELAASNVSGCAIRHCRRSADYDSGRLFQASGATNIVRLTGVGLKSYGLLKGQNQTAGSHQAASAGTPSFNGICRWRQKLWPVPACLSMVLPPLIWQGDFAAFAGRPKS